MRRGAGPAVLRAAFVRALGGPAALEVGELPVPRPGPTDVLVRVEAAAIDHVDLVVLSGSYPTPTPFRFVAGRDAVGTVTDTGEGAASRFAPGDRVWTNSLGHAGRQGAFAQYAVVPADRLYRPADRADALEAVALAHAGVTAAIGLRRRARVRAGDNVVIGAGGGGGGSAAVRLAELAGARVVATASADDLARVRGLGADAALDRRAGDLAERRGDAVGPGADIACDTSGRMDLAGTLGLLAPGGTLLVTAGMDTRHEITAGDLYTRDAAVRGFAMSSASVEDLAEAARAVGTLLSADPVPVRIAETVGLDGVAGACERLASGGVRGRIVVRIAAPV
ncbi:zinc-binding dehydrogenase [Brachybacterium huguangmaarense]